jgi:4-amino-4-deoxy-L-arabinose transferase-like glycosyltransferase
MTSSRTPAAAPRHAAFWVAILLALALVVRLGVVAGTTDYELRSDPADYDRHGRSIAAGNGYPESGTTPSGGPTAYWPPGYPYFVGLVYAIAGDRPNAVRIAQAFVGTFTVALVGLLGWQLWGGRAALCAMGLAAIFPPLLVVDTALTPEALFLPLMLGAVAAALRSGRSPTPWRWAVAAGVLGGLAILTRVNGAPLLVAVALAVWGRPPRLSLRAALPAVLLLATAAATVAPWTIRNAVVTDAFVPVSSQAGYTLAGTYNARSDADETYPAAWRPPVVEARRVLRARPDVDEVELGGELRASATDYLLDHPLYVVEVAVWNTIRLLHLDGFSYVRADNFNLGVGQTLSDASVIALWLVLPLAVAGAVHTRTRRPPLLFWLAPLAMVIAPIFIVGEIRFRAPIDLFLLLLAGLALSVKSRPRRLLAAGSPRARGPAVRSSPAPAPVPPRRR